MSEQRTELRETTGHPNALKLETAAFAPAADPALLEAERRHIDACAVCAEKVKALRDGRDAFLAERPPAEFLVSLRVNAETKNNSVSFPTAFFAARRTAIVGIAALLLLGLGVVFFRALARETGETGEPPGIAFKGQSAASVSLALYVSRNGDAAVPWVKNEPFHPGDILRFGVRSDTAGYVSVINLDDRGRTSIYFPGDNPRFTRIEPGKTVVLDGSIVLDDFIGDELIFAIVSAEPISGAHLAATIEKTFARAEGKLDRMNLSASAGAVGITRITKISK